MFAARFQALVEHVFDDQTHHDLTQMRKDMDQMIFGVYDLTECVQGSLIIILIQSLGYFKHSYCQMSTGFGEITSGTVDF